MKNTMKNQVKNNQKTLGVVGGLGPETGCTFCLNVNNKLKRLRSIQPHILLDNLPVSREAEEGIINGGASEEHFELLRDSIERFNDSAADLLVIPCNTVHIFMDELRKVSKKPILSIIDECVNECRRRKINKVGLLASEKTVKENLFGDSEIEFLLPEEQKEINSIIIKIINHEHTERDKKKLVSIINDLKKAGAQAIVLGCTDLHLIIDQDDCDIPLLDTCTILEDSAVEMLISS